MSYPKNPLVGKRSWKGYDWPRVESDTFEKYPVIEQMLRDFANEHSYWVGEISKGSMPSTIEITLYLRPAANPRRKSLGQPDRLAEIRHDELDQAGALVSAMLAAAPKLKSSLQKGNGFLFYTLKIKNLDLYRAR